MNSVQKTSISISEDTHKRLWALARKHTGKISHEITWLVNLGEAIIQLLPSDREIIEGIIERMRNEEDAAESKTCCKD